MMNLKNIRLIARQEMPIVEVKTIEGAYRHNVVDSLSGENNVGIELGVAKGIFSARMVNSGKFSEFFGVDVYGDIHDTNEYKSALKLIGLNKNYKLLRMTFDDAIDLFDDEYFDFIYVDGFAHSGEEGGETLFSWYKKLKIGGIMAGDDYHDDWPLVKWAVNDLVDKLCVELHVTGMVEKTDYCKYPSWYFYKKEHDGRENLIATERLRKIGKSERKRIQNIRMSDRGLFRAYLVAGLERVGLKKILKKLLNRN